MKTPRRRREWIKEYFLLRCLDSQSGLSFNSKTVYDQTKFEGKEETKIAVVPFCLPEWNSLQMLFQLICGPPVLSSNFEGLWDWRNIEAPSPTLSRLYVEECVALKAVRIHQGRKGIGQLLRVGSLMGLDIVLTLAFVKPHLILTYLLTYAGRAPGWYHIWIYERVWRRSWCLCLLLAYLDFSAIIISGSSNLQLLHLCILSIY